MKILLVVYDNDSYIHWFPQGLAFIAAVLKKAGYEIEIYNQDLHHYPDQHLTDYLDINKFDAVGVSVIAGYYQYKKLLGISDAINRSKNRPIYIIGGHSPSPEPEYFIDKTIADVIVIGEREPTAIELFDTLASGKSLKNIKGTAFKDGEKVIANERRPLIEDIDSIPFPADDFFPIEYYRLNRITRMNNSDFMMPVLSGRGCTCYRIDKGFRPISNGFVERFNRTILDEFFRITFRKKPYSSVEELQLDLEKWLKNYNDERPHRGYRNMGKRPIETFMEAKKLIPREAKNKEVFSEQVASVKSSLKGASCQVSY